MATEWIRIWALIPMWLPGIKGQGSLIVHGLWFCTLMWAFNSSISTQLHLQLLTGWLVSKTLTFPKLPFPIARKISKWSKVTARKSNISILNGWANIWRYHVISTFYPYELKKMRDTPEIFCSFWRFGFCLTGLFFLYGSASKANSLGQPLSMVIRSPSEHSHSALLHCLLEILASPCSCWDQMQSWLHKTLISCGDIAITFAGMMAQSNHSKGDSDQLQHLEGTQAFRHRCPFSNLEQL